MNEDLRYWYYDLLEEYENELEAFQDVLEYVEGDWRY